MSKKITVEHEFNGLTTPYSSYDPYKTNLGYLISQQDGYAGPLPLGLARPNEASIANAGAIPVCVPIDDDNIYVYLGDAANSGTTRRVMLYRYRISTSSFTWLGVITVTFPGGGAALVMRALEVYEHLYTTGTVAVSGTAVTGTSTVWQTARYAVGARIGFGSTNPNNITDWYDISAMGSNTSITLDRAAPTYSAGTAYVIQEHRIFVGLTSSTASAGGLFVLKGISPSTFTLGGVNISAAATTDNVRAAYWLTDAATNTITAIAGIVAMPPTSDTDQDVYVLTAPTTTSAQFFKFNARGALSLTAGKDVSAFLFKTGSQAVTGTMQQLNSLCLATLNHGPSHGVPSFFFVTTSRIARAKLSDIFNGNINFITDYMAEKPPYGFNETFNFIHVAYSPAIDRLFVIANGNTGGRNYITKYNTNNDQMDHLFTYEDRQIDFSAFHESLQPHPNTGNTSLPLDSYNGIAYIARNATQASSNQVWSVPVEADWSYTSDSNANGRGRLITPAMPTANARRLLRLSVCNKLLFGEPAFGTMPEPYRCYVRTRGILDNSGGWQPVSDNGDLSGFVSGDYVQVMFEFRIIGWASIPAQIYSVAVTYEEDSLGDYFIPSHDLSDIANKRFVWKHQVAFGQNVPDVRILIRDAANNNVLVEDNTKNPVGSFQKSTNGGSSWFAWNYNDLTNNNTYIRYTPVALPANIEVVPSLTEL